MNTNNFEPFKYVKETWLKTVFEKQKNILDEYLEYEKISYDDFDINVYEDQKIMKDFLQIRFVEELNEATLDQKNADHFLEEMVDAFNFLLEAYIIYGLDEKSFSWNSKGTLDQPCINAAFYEVIESVGKSCNFLKNRPWKQTQYLVDLIPFEISFLNIWDKFNRLCNYLKITDEELFKIWSLKFQVNEYRLRTKY